MARRLYLGVLPPEQVVERLDQDLEPARRRAAHQGANLRWMDPGQWHVTVLFAPRVDEEQLDALREALPAALEPVQPFPLSVQGGSAFPGLARARHLVADLADPERGLPRVAHALRSTARGLGIEHATEPFRPHLTLARLNRPSDRTRDALWLEELRTDPWQVSDVALVESHPATGRAGGQRAHHRVLRRVPLGR